MARRPDPDRAEQQQERVGEDRDEEEALSERGAEVAAARARNPYTAIIAETTAQIAEITASADHAVRCIALNGSASESRNVIAASSRTPLRSRQPQQHIVK